MYKALTAAVMGIIAATSLFAAGCQSARPKSAEVDSIAVEAPEGYLPKGSTLEGLSITVSGAAGTRTIPITPDMLSGFDADRAGLQTVTVCYGACTDAFDVYVVDREIVSTDQLAAALAAQADGQIWGIRNGTYPLQLALTTDVTVIGQSDRGVVVAGTDFLGTAPIACARDASVTLKNLVLRGQEATRTVFDAHSAAADLINITIENGDCGITAAATAPNKHLTVRSCLIRGFQSTALIAESSVSRLTVSGCCIAGGADETGQVGIRFSCLAEIVGNNIKNLSGTGLYALGAPDGCIIEDNVFDNVSVLYDTF